MTKLNSVKKLFKDTFSSHFHIQVVPFSGRKLCLILRPFRAHLFAFFDQTIILHSLFLFCCHHRYYHVTVLCIYVVAFIFIVVFVCCHCRYCIRSPSLYIPWQGDSSAAGVTKYKIFRSLLSSTLLTIILSLLIFFPIFLTSYL